MGRTVLGLLGAVVIPFGRARGCVVEQMHDGGVGPERDRSVDGGAAAPDSPVFGRKLSRKKGLRHPRLPGFWQLVDTVLEHDELVRGHVYGTRAQGGE
jgi:hypothetical protein